MARTRLGLVQILREILGSNNVYFSPPAHMKYPCIKYEEIKPYRMRADDLLYNKVKCYSVTVIDTNPDSQIKERVEELPMCSFDRPYISDGLYHWVYTLYY